MTSLAARKTGSIEPYLHKEIPMKRSALAGLFITAAMLASPAFAAGTKDDLCQINLAKSAEIRFTEIDEVDNDRVRGGRASDAIDAASW